MSDKVLISITEKGDGLEVQVNEGAYGNLAVVGLLEKIKLTLMTESSEVHSGITVPIIKSGDYDA